MYNINKNSLLSCTAFVTASLIAATSSNTAMASASSQSSYDNAHIADIVVTAQRREESLQKVPVSVTAISTEQLDTLRVTSVRSLAGIAPSLQIASQGMQSNPTIIIRGVTSGQSSNSVDPKMGMYIDGVYVGRTTGSLLDMSDIERIEVLRGPQGTLFGRNATSGAISIITAQPKGEWGAKGTISYGNYRALRGKISLDLPQMGPFSARVSYLHDEIRGDIKNLIAGQEINLAVRAPEFGTQKFVKRLGGRNIDAVQVAVRGEFGNLTADYRFDYSDANMAGRGMQSLGVIPDASGQLLAPIVNLQPFFGGDSGYNPDSRSPAVANATSNERNVTQGHSLTLTLEANDNLTVKSISAFRRFKQHPVIYDLGGAGGMRFTFGQMGALLTPGLTDAQRQAILFDPANMPGANDYFFPLLSARAIKQRQFSQELQAQVSTDAFDLVAGVFYFHERSPGTEVLGILQPVPSGTLVPSPLDDVFGSGVTRTISRNSSMAGYAQATFHVSDQFDLTAGARGTIDDRKLSILAVSGAQGGALGVGEYSAEYKKLTYNATATWRPSNDTTLFAKMSTGYVSGGILSGIPYKPETLTAYEIGAKTQFLDNRVRLNMAAYYNDYKDLQTQNFINGRQFFDNAGKAKIKGFEAELDIVPARGLTLSGSLAYTDFNYKKFILNGQDVSSVARPTYFSKWTGRAAAVYNSPALNGSDGVHLTAMVETRYRSSYYLTSTPLVDIMTGQPALEDVNKRPGYWLVNGRLGLADMAIGGSRATLSVYGDNLLNKRYMSFGAPVLLLTGTYERGRTYGVELGMSF